MAEEVAAKPDAQTTTQTESRKRVVVIGAGVGGLHVAQALRNRKDTLVTLVSPSECFLFLPRLTELFAKSIPEPKGCMLLRDVWKGDLAAEKATIVNPHEKHVVLESGKQLPYDILVVAVGSVVNFFGTPGTEYCYPFYSKTDMERLHDHVLSLLEADEQPGTRTFTVVGGGPTGCEVAYALSMLLAQKKVQGKIVVVDLGPSVLAAFPQNLREAVAAALEKQGITIMPNTGVVSVTPMSLELKKQDGSKESMPCYTTIWAAGSKPVSIAVTGIEKTSKGEFQVKPTLQVQADEHIFALGDCAAAGCPKTAQAAIQQAELVGKNVQRLLAGKELLPFAFKEKGVIIALEKDTVGLFYGRLLKGFIAQQIRDKYYMMTLGNYK